MEKNSSITKNTETFTSENKKMENKKLENGLKGWISITANIIENELENELEHEIERTILNKIAEKYPNHTSDQMEIQYILTITIEKKGE